MWLNLDLCGIDFKLRIKDYQPSLKEIWYIQWCSVDYSFVKGNCLNCQRDNGEPLLSCEVEDLAMLLDDLLADELDEVKVMKCIEPDFLFVFTPKEDLIKDTQYTCAAGRREAADIHMDLKLFFWDDGLTNNYLSVTFYRKDIEYLLNYLLLVMKKIDITNPRVQEMLENGILIDRSTEALHCGKRTFANDKSLG